MVKSSQVLKLLRNGKTNKEIAEITKTTIANIKAHKKRLIRSGSYQTQDSGAQFQMDLNGLTDWMIERLEMSKRVKDVEAENYKLRNHIASLENELHNLKEDAQVKVLREHRYKLALQHGEINPPVLVI